MSVHTRVPLTRQRPEDRVGSCQQDQVGSLLMCSPHRAGCSSLSSPGAMVPLGLEATSSWFLKESKPLGLLSSPTHSKRQKPGC